MEYGGVTVTRRESREIEGRKYHPEIPIWSAAPGQWKNVCWVTQEEADEMSRPPVRPASR